MNFKPEGIIPPLVTPFSNDGSLNTAMLRKVINNNPARTGVHLSVDTIKTLSKIDNIVGMKDSSGDMTFINEVIRQTADENFSLLCGRGTLIFSSLSVFKKTYPISIS